MTAIAKVQEQVKQRLLDGLKTQGLKWFQPWNTEGQSYIPINRKSGKSYNGVNVIFLNAEMKASGYTHNEWLTYKQATELGGHVMRGQKSHEVYFWSIFYVDADGNIYKTKEDAKGEPVEKRFSLKTYKVFNIAQCEGIEPRNPAEPIEESEFNPVAEAQAIIDNWSAKPKIVNKPQNRAFYRPATDVVTMPMPQRFCDADSYYKTLFHELVHSTGHESRLNRKGVAGGSFFGDATYSAEELVAESGAMILSGIANLNPKDGDTNSQAYINGWVKGVEETPAKAIVSALTQSAKAVDFILNK